MNNTGVDKNIVENAEVMNTLIQPTHYYHIWFNGNLNVLFTINLIGFIMHKEYSFETHKHTAQHKRSEKTNQRHIDTQNKNNTDRTI